MESFNQPVWETIINHYGKAALTWVFEMPLDMGVTPTRTLLTMAIYHDNIDAVRWLLDLGADVNGLCGGPNPLCEAINPAIYGIQSEIAKLLLARGADPNGEVGSVPLIEALRNHDKDTEEIVTLLLDSGASVNVYSDAYSNIHSPVANIIGQFYATPLHLAAGFGHVNIVERLLSLGADVNAKGDKGATPLHCVWGVEPKDNGPWFDKYLESQSAIVKLLLQSGADANALDEDSLTPLQWFEYAIAGDEEPLHRIGVVNILHQLTIAGARFDCPSLLEHDKTIWDITGATQNYLGAIFHLFAMLALLLRKGYVISDEEQVLLESSNKLAVQHVAMQNPALEGSICIVVPFVKTVKEPILRNLLSLFWEHPVDFDRRCIP